MKKITAIIITLLMLTTIIQIMPSVSAPSGGYQHLDGTWWDSNWNYCKKITIDHTKVSANLTNFPVLIDNASSSFSSHAQTDGDDFVFTVDNTTKLNHEIESYNSTSGELIAWVNVTSLSSTVDTIIYLYYGNSGCSSQQNKNGVWDNHYMTVQHLNDTTTSTTSDSTVNAVGGTKYETNGPTETTGKIDKAQDFDGVNDYVDFGTGLNMTGGGTVSFWLYYQNAGYNSGVRVLVSKRQPADGGACNYQFFIHEGEGGALYGYNGASGSTIGSHIPHNTWTYVTIARTSSTNMSLYYDGVYNAKWTWDWGTSNSYDVYIGANSWSWQGPPSTYATDCLMDEFRLSSSTRNASWISTEYNNQNSPSTFMTFGDEETLPPSIVSPIVTTNDATGITSTNATLNGYLADGGENILEFEYYNVTADYAWGFDSTNWASQTFTIGNTGTNATHFITSVKLELHRQYSLPGTIVVSIKATDTNGKPTGANLTWGTTNGNTLTTEPTGEWRQINLTAYPLTQGTKYAIVCEAPSSSVYGGPMWLSKTTPTTYSGGSFCFSSNSGSSWTVVSSDDCMFEEYGYFEGEECTVGFEYGETTEYGTNVTPPYTGTGLPTYIYVGGVGNYVYQYWIANMTKKAESDCAGGSINALVEDDTYVYAGGDINAGYKVYQIWKSNMTTKATSIDGGGAIRALAQDETYIYASESGMMGDKVSQYWKSNMTKKAEASEYGGVIYALAEDDTYVYAGGWNNTFSNYKVHQYWKSNMTKKAETADCGGIIYALAEDSIYIYASGGGNVSQYWKSNMTKRAETIGYGGEITALAQDSTYIYAGGDGMMEDTVCQYWKSNMTKRAETSGYGGVIYALTQDDLYIYAGGDGMMEDTVCQYWKSNMTLKTQSAGYGGNIYSLSTSPDTYLTGDTFSFDATELSPGTLYHYRAFATNSIGTSYGEDKNFTTLGMHSLNIYMTVGGDHVDKDPDQEMYQYGDIVELTAYASAYSIFSHWWTTTSESYDNPYSYEIVGDTDVVAYFILTHYNGSFTGAGSGTAESPYQITNCEELNQTWSNLTAYYILMNDIDMDACGVQYWNGGAGFVPIGDETTQFTGNFDGQNHTIGNLFINRPSAPHQGLFGYVNTGGAVKNLVLLNINITATERIGLVGQSSGTVTNCHSSGEVAGLYYTGGIIGYDDGTVSNCSSTVNVTGTDAIGGLIGFDYGTVTNCYSTGVIIGTGYDAGGLIGSTGGTVTNCYSKGNVTGVVYVGGLIGIATTGSSIINCYSTGRVTGDSGVGGLIGDNESGMAIITNSYWDTETSGQATSYGGEGRTTAEMTYDYDGYDPPETGLYEDWDLANYVGDDSIWVHDDLTQNNGYPLFRTDYSSTLDISMTPESVDFGAVNVGESAQTSSYYFNLSNNGIACSVTINATNTQNWTFVSWAEHGLDKFCMNISKDDWSSEINVASDGTTELTYNLPIGGYQLFDIKVILPTGISHTSQGESFVITFTTTAI